MHLFAWKKLDLHEHQLVAVHLMQKHPLLEFRYRRLRLPRDKCHFKAPCVHFDLSVVDVGVLSVILEFFGGCLYDSSLLPMYANHAIRHVWDGEVK